MLQRACPWGSTHILPPNTPPSFECCLQLVQILGFLKVLLGRLQILKRCNRGHGILPSTPSLTVNRQAGLKDKKPIPIASGQVFVMTKIF